MSLTAWFVKTFLRQPKTQEQSDDKVKTISVPEVPSTPKQPPSTVYKISYYRDSDYTYQDTISVNGSKIKKGCIEDNLKALCTYLSLKHNFSIEHSHLSRMAKLCSVGLSEKINLSSNVVLDLRVTLE